MNKRNTHGMFDCPVHNCETTIIGTYSDLVAHVDAHPLAEVFVDEEGKTQLEQVKNARDDALTRDIREHMKVGTKQNSDVEDKK